jgi:hypothetical protein
VFNSAWEAHALWLYGLEDRALMASNEAVRRAHRIDHAYSVAVAQAYAALLHFMRGDAYSCADAAEATQAVCRRHEFGYYGQLGTILGAWARHGADPHAAADTIGEALASLDRGDSWARRPIYLAALAEVLAAAGRVPEAIASLERAEAFIVRSGDRVWSSEAMRLRAKLTSDPALAQHALEVARRLCSRPLVLRCAVTLARVPGGDPAMATRLVRDALGGLPDAGASLDRGRALALLSA